MNFSMNRNQLHKSAVDENALCAFASDLRIPVGQIPDELFIETDDGSYMEASFTTVQLSMDNQIEAFLYKHRGLEHDTMIQIFND